MVEEYSGVKFKPVCELRKVVSHPKIQELVRWGKTLAENGLAPDYETPEGTGSGGNLSFRTENGMITTASYSHLGSLRKEDFAEVLLCDVDKKEVHFIGVRNPSSESIMHWLVYKNRPEVNAIFHFHDDSIVKNTRRLGLPVTREYHPYGTLELAREVVSTLDDNWFLVLKDHGCLSLGKTIDEAGERSIKIHKKTPQHL